MCYIFSETGENATNTSDVKFIICTKAITGSSLILQWINLPLEQHCSHSDQLERIHNCATLGHDATMHDDNDDVLGIRQKCLRLRTVFNRQWC